MAIIVVMGVSGVGKSSVAQALASRIGGASLDADDFHPPANKQKMAQGTPLEDADRWGWLDAVRDAITAQQSPHVVVACSALKARYRQRLVAGLDDAHVVYLKAPADVVRARLAGRRDHFMPASLLGSQLQTLEEPAADAAIIIDARASVAEIVERVVTELSATA